MLAPWSLTERSLHFGHVASPTGRKQAVLNVAVKTAVRPVRQDAGSDRFKRPALLNGSISLAQALNLVDQQAARTVCQVDREKVNASFKAYPAITRHGALSPSTRGRREKSRGPTRPKWSYEAVGWAKRSVPTMISRGKSWWHAALSPPSYGDLRVKTFDRSGVGLARCEGGARGHAKRRAPTVFRARIGFRRLLQRLTASPHIRSDR